MASSHTEGSNRRGTCSQGECGVCGVGVVCDGSVICEAAARMCAVCIVWDGSVICEAAIKGVCV